MFLDRLLQLLSNFDLARVKLYLLPQLMHLHALGIEYTITIITLIIKNDYLSLKISNIRLHVHVIVVQSVIFSSTLIELQD